MRQFLALIKALIPKLLRAMAIQAPLSLWLFPLVAHLHKRKPQRHYPAFHPCCANFNGTIDVIVSLYRFERYFDTLRASLETPCSGGVNYWFLVVRPSPSELNFVQTHLNQSNFYVRTTDDMMPIYKAWNYLISLGSGEFITNLNADDFRVPHSICNLGQELKARTDSSGLYSDFLLSRVPFTNKDAGRDLWESDLPRRFTLRDLSERRENFMHCAPIWRRSLHDKLGVFDEEFQSSGDAEMWLRILTSGCKLDKSNSDFSSVYFHNPAGLSSSFASKGFKEWNGVQQRSRSLTNSKLDDQ